MLPALLALLQAASSPAAPDTAPADPAALMAPGVSRELAAYRAARLRDVRYELALDVTGRDTAAGRAVLRFTRSGGGDVVVDFRGLSLGNARVNGRPAPALERNGAHVRVPAALLAAGANALEFDFAAAVAPAGASVVRFRDATDGADYLYTLLVPADANALFPCFDQPDLKARVTLTLTTPAAWTAVANGAARDSAVRGATRVWRFAETQPISTYLVAFAAGPWSTVRRTVRGRPMTMYVRRSRAAEAEADSLVASNARAIDWLAGYFGRPYPFDKFDFVLAPAFPFGGMEHPGAVFYNEESFVYRERPTATQRLGRTATVYHEVAHQWFGDLVTMRWFDDLWLKEGFATYMAAKMQAALDPASGAWKTFYLRNKPPAYAVDVTPGTTPVWQALANLDQAKSNYGAIVYNKAPAVLKQLEYLVGDTTFRRGLRGYLAAHAYGNAAWPELLGAVTTAGGRGLDEWGRQFILRPGMPLVEQQRSAGGDTVRLVQRPAQPALSGAGPWPMRMELLAVYPAAGAAAGKRAAGDRAGDAAGGAGGDDVVGGGPPRRSAAGAASRWTAVRVPVWLTGDTTVVALPRRGSPAYVHANGGDYGYAVTLLDDASVRWAEAHVRELADPLDRAMLWGALWDLVREARLAPARFVALAARELPAERDEQIASAVLGRVVRTTTRYLADAERARALPALERTLAAVADDPTRPYGIRKAHLDALVAVAGTPAALAALDRRLDDSTAAGAPLRAPTRWAIVTRLVETGAPPAERRLAAEARRDSTSEGRRRAFVAGAARGDSATKAAYFRRYFADRALNEDWATASLGAFNAPGQRRLTERFVRPALDSLGWVQRNRRIFYLGSWLEAFVAGQTSPEALAAVDAFLAARPALGADLRSKVLQSADELRRTVAVRRTFGDATAPGPRAAADSLSLERRGCYGSCPTYRVRLTAAGLVAFVERREGGTGRTATDRVPAAAVRRLLDEARALGFPALPAALRDDRRLCPDRRTDQEVVVLTIYTGRVSKAVDDDRGCLPTSDPAAAETVRRLRALQAAVDSVARTSRWVRPASRR